MPDKSLVRLAATAACGALLWTAVLPAQPSHPDEPRMAPLPPAQWTEELRNANADFAALGMPNLVATYARHPGLAPLLLPHLHYVWTESTLPPRARALLALRTAWLTRSQYLWAHRAALARGEGLTDEDLERIARGPDAAGWNELDAALLRAADELHVDAFITDATWATLSAHYDTNQMVDAIDAVGALTMHAGALSSLGVELEPAIDEQLPSRVPYTVSASPTRLRLTDTGRPRIPPVEAPDGARAGGANVFRTFVRNPPSDRVRGALNRHINDNDAITLAPRQRELLLTRIGVLCRSEYEYAAHLRVGRRVGMTDEDVAHVLAGPGSGAAPLDDALLRAADELHRDDVVSEQTWNTLAAELDPPQLIDVLFAVGAYRSGSMLISSAGVQLDADMADFRFPPELR